MSAPSQAPRAVAAILGVVAALSVSPPALAAPCADPCDDSNVCTVNDHCSDDLCRGAALPNGSPCNDGDPATAGETCQSGLCEGVPGDGGAEPDAPGDAQDDAADPNDGAGVAASGEDGACTIGPAGRKPGWAVALGCLIAIAWYLRLSSPRA